MAARRTDDAKIVRHEVAPAAASQEVVVIVLDSTDENEEMIVVGKGKKGGGRVAEENRKEEIREKPAKQKEKETIVTVIDDDDDGDGKVKKGSGRVTEENRKELQEERANEKEEEEEERMPTLDGNDGESPNKRLLINFDEASRVQLLRPETTAADADEWRILDEDRYDFGFYLQLARCWECDQPGHQAHACPNKRAPVCYLCGGGHVIQRCRRVFCNNCLAPNHTQRTCSRPRKHRLLCRRCFMKGHEMQDCPDQWRMYHRTTVAGPVEEREDGERANANSWCCNCATSGHFVFECFMSLMDRDMMRTTQFVKSYKEIHGQKRKLGASEASGNIQPAKRRWWEDTEEDVRRRKDREEAVRREDRDEDVRRREDREEGVRRGENREEGVRRREDRDEGVRRREDREEGVRRREDRDEGVRRREDRDEGVRRREDRDEGVRREDREEGVRRKEEAETDGWRARTRSSAATERQQLLVSVVPETSSRLVEAVKRSPAKTVREQSLQAVERCARDFSSAKLFRAS
ncbi:PREDICTED: zinc finger CCHC domain-containing protein 7-like [Priapulus caudatus]|uniref:Zinc finger CCHC domain-containing protein 7 n=1 Tax=Priapulus caudatus TaxID=37621 RepID=A0ABM1F5U5_PRICU|nr:PREDICTED: zinc finger CCHC domain-containing protein 7-like [Priapulus caudatus]